MKKLKIIIVLVILVVVSMIFFPYFKAEYLTFLYGEEFEGLELQTKMMDLSSYHKVISYSDNTARVYYVSSGKGGCVIDFDKIDNAWIINKWEMIWSHYGSADKFHWPYYR